MSDFDIWHIDRNKWKKQGSLTGLLKKFAFGERVILGPKIAYPHNSGSARRMFLEFWTMKETNR